MPVLTDRIAYWDRFGHPDFKTLKYDLGIPDDMVVGRRQGGQDGRRAVRRGPSGLTRRGVLAAGGAALAAPLLPPFAWAAGRSGLHGLSIFGELKYPADFKHFDYVDADAPKGGRMNFQPSYWVYNQSTADLQHAQFLRAQGRCAAAHGDDLRHADGGRRGRAELLLRARRRDGGRLRRRQRLHLPSALGGRASTTARR